MERKEKIKRLFGDFITKGGKVITLVLIFAFGYFCSEIYHKLNNPEKVEEASTPKETKRIGKISVAINERNELMIIDRTNGSYEIYQDSIGRCIFNLYANSIQAKYDNQ